MHFCIFSNQGCLLFTTRYMSHVSVGHLLLQIDLLSSTLHMGKCNTATSHLLLTAPCCLCTVQSPGPCERICFPVSLYCIFAYPVGHISIFFLFVFDANILCNTNFVLSISQGSIIIAALYLCRGLDSSLETYILVEILS